MVAIVRGVHALYVAFVLVAPLLLVIGVLLDVRALRGRGLRLAHAAAVTFVGLQYAFDWSCPLSQLENALAGRPPEETFLPPMEGAIPVVVGVAVVAYLALSVAAHGAAWRASVRRLA